jgi:polysaccharide pyruvyl transferase WcaK-like protein
MSQDNRDEVQRPVIYTPGVLAGGAEVSAGAVARDVRALADGGAPVHYLVVEEEDEWVAPAAAEAGANVIPLGAISWERMTAYLGSAKCVVSGRYHINIFSMLAGVPFLPMETNTPKMKGVLRLVGVGDSGSIRSWSEEKSPDLQDVILVPAEAVERSCRMASDVIKSWYPT